MSPRAIVTLLLVLVGVAAGLAVPALRRPSTGEAFNSRSVARTPTTASVAHIDPLPDLGPMDLPAPPRRAGFDVAAVQRRLFELGYFGGPVNGARSSRLRSALMAFQKVNGLGADGSIGPATLAALEHPLTPRLRGGPARRVEVDLSKQVLYYVEGGRLERIMPISSGNGASYRLRDGTIARSLTPVGSFRVERNLRGVRKADLGELHDPMYFYLGWAIHGSDSVPAYPASHGCVRVTRADALWLFSRIPPGTALSVYGGSHTFVPGSGTPGTDLPAGDTAGELAADAGAASPARPAGDQTAGGQRAAGQRAAGQREGSERQDETRDAAGRDQGRGAEATEPIEGPRSADRSGGGEAATGVDAPGADPPPPAPAGAPADR